jgi:hypothetical protein
MNNCRCIKEINPSRITPTKRANMRVFNAAKIVSFIQDLRAKSGVEP